MDVDLLSRMISELVVDHDRVGLPGVGTFYADVVPSTFSDRGYTINPPYRRLSFLPNAAENDLLVNFYSDVNGIPAEVAREYLTQFLSELAAVLRKRKSIMLPGLGRLRATKENNFFFVPDEKLDIYPEAFGLESVSLKTLPTMDDERVEIPFEFRAVKAKAASAAETAGSASGTGLPEPAAATTAASATGTPAGPAATSAGLTETVDPAKPAQPAEQTTAQPSGQTSTAAVAATETTKPVDQPAAVEASVQDGSAAAQDEPAAEEGEAAETTTEAPEKAGAAEAPKANVASEKAEAPEATEAPVATKATEAPEAETAAATENQPKRFRWWIPLLVLLALAAVALVAFLILAHAAPDFIDSILYTPEQLRIINY